MTLAQTWLRQVLGAAGASLLAPVAIVLAAAVLVAGGGLGGLSELGQITSGPSLPAADLAPGGSAIEEADIVGADLSAPPPALATAPPGPLGGAPVAGGTAPSEPDGGPLPSPLVQVPPSAPGGGGAPSGGVVTPPTQSPGGGGGTSGGGPSGPVETTRGGVEPLVPEPVQPVTENLLNLLLGPQP